MLSVGIVGGGINGMTTAWALAKAGHAVTVYEQNTAMSATSQASSKLLHGGLRYLENFEFRLVKEALHERDAWLKAAPHLARPLQLLVPVYKKSRRSRWAYALGLKLYDLLASNSQMPRSKWHSREAVLNKHPSLNSDGLLGAYSFWDGQMDDLALGQWVMAQAVNAGTKVLENTQVERVSADGQVTLTRGQQVRHDRVINVAGPWAEKLAQKSCIHLPYELDLVRGSHIVLQDPCAQAWLLEVPNERRIFFVLPWKGQTLVGTTEVRQGIEEPVVCSEQEQDYLLTAYQHYFPQASATLAFRIAGVRPLIKGAKDPSKATREYALHHQGKLLTVLGGKWTTSMALARKVAEKIENETEH